MSTATATEEKEMSGVWVEPALVPVWSRAVATNSADQDNIVLHGRAEEASCRHAPPEKNLTPPWFDEEARSKSADEHVELARR